MTGLKGKPDIDEAFKLVMLSLKFHEFHEGLGSCRQQISNQSLSGQFFARCLLHFTTRDHGRLDAIWIYPNSINRDVHARDVSHLRGTGPCMLTCGPTIRQLFSSYLHDHR